MKKADVHIVEEKLNLMFPPEWLRATARETGLVKRERKIDPLIMFWVLTLSYGVRLQRTLAALKRSYEKAADVKLSDSSWYYRFTPEMTAFLKRCVEHGIEHLAQEPRRELRSRLGDFKDLLIQDSTIVRLHHSLSNKWPSTQSHKAAAGVKIGMLVSAVSDGPKKVALYSERTNELKTLRVGPWVKDRILLIDLGFFKYQLFTRITENGGSFVSRLKNKTNPLITAVHNNCRGNKIDVVGKRLNDVLPRLKRQILDLDVEVEFKRRKYKGKQRTDTTTFRLVALYNPEDRKYHAYLTNIRPEVLSAEEIATLYSARWDVELIFKELKSRYALDKIATTNPQIVEAHIWVALLTLLVSRRIYCLVRDRSGAENIVRYTRLRWSTIFAENSGDQLTLILAYNGIQRTLETIMDIYDSQALDPHIDRDRLMEDWVA